MTRITFNDGQSFHDDMEDFGRAASHSTYRPTQDHQAPGEAITGGRTSGGTPLSTAQLDDKAIIRVAGGETSVGAALAAGLVSRQPDGSLVTNDPFTGRPTSPAPKGHPQDHWMEQAASQERLDSPLSVNRPGEAGRSDSGETDPDQPPMEAMDSDTEALITEAAASGEDSTVAGIVEAVSHGVDASDQHLGYIASRLGIEPEEARERYETIRAGFTKQAEQRISKDTGLPPQAVFEWAWQEQPELMSEAIKGHLNDRSTNGYSKVAKAYMENLDTIDPDGLVRALERNGFEKIERTSKGKILFSDGSGQMEWKAAVRSGIIKPAGL